MNEAVQSELKKILNGRFSQSESTRANYARGEDTYDPVLSEAVVFPETNEEVSKILKLCNEHKIPVVPFGTGTSLEGNVVGNKNGITIKPEKDTERVMDFISIRIGLLFPKLVWKINKNNRERKITTTTL